MLPETDLPDSFNIASNLGYFIMRKNSADGYSGCANGCSLSVVFRFSEERCGYVSELKVSSDKWGSCSAVTEGGFVSLDGFLSCMSKWMDDICSEMIEDYAEDVRYFETGKGRIAYWCYNTHLDSTPVVFIHGGPGGDSNPVKARRLHLPNPVYLYDQLGCGMSDRIPDLDSWTADDYVAELRSFIESIPSEKVILIGASWGSGLSVAYAAATGCGRIKAMVLPSPFLSSRKWSEDAEANLAAMGGDYLDKYRDFVARGDFGPGFIKILVEYNTRYLFNRAKYREYGIYSASEVPNEVFRKLCGPNDLYTDGTLKDFDVTWFLPEIDVPVLLMCADSDEVTIPRIMEYYNSIRGARLSIIPHAGHVLALEQFDSYRAAIQAFFLENGL